MGGGAAKLSHGGDGLPRLLFTILRGQTATRRPVFQPSAGLRKGLLVGNRERSPPPRYPTTSSRSVTATATWW